MALTLNNTSRYLEELITAGADAMSNLYYLEFAGGKFSDVGTGITVRSSQITLPKFTHTTNTVNFMTVSADMPKAEITGKKEISVTIRLDAEYQIYKALLDQQKLTTIPDLGYAATVVPEEISNNTDNTFKVKLYSMNSAVSSEDYETEESLEGTSYYQLLYEFKYCWIKSISRPTFSYDNANAQTVTVKIGFYDYEDPQNLLSSSTTADTSTAITTSKKQLAQA